MTATLSPSKAIKLVGQTLRTATTTIGEVVAVPKGAFALCLQTAFLYGSGGTAAKAYLQTSVDGGLTWIDIACHAFTTTAATKISAVRISVALAAAYTPTDGSLTDDTIKDGLLGDRVRIKVVTTGTYAGASSVTSYLTFAD